MAVEIMCPLAVLFFGSKLAAFVMITHIAYYASVLHNPAIEPMQKYDQISFGMMLLQIIGILFFMCLPSKSKAS